MKRVWSVLLVVAMLLSMFSVSAFAYKRPFEKADKALWLMNFENDEVDTKYGDGKIVENTDVAGNAKVMSLAAPARTVVANNSTGKITVPEFRFGETTYVEFKAKCAEGDLPVVFKINDGTNTPLMRRYLEIPLVAEDFADGWHTVSLYVKEATNGNCSGTVTVTNDATGEKTVTTVSADTAKWGDAEYFITYSMLAPANSVATTWLIDDIGFYGEKLDVYSGNSFTDLIGFERADDPLNAISFENAEINTKYGDAKVVEVEDGKALSVDAITRTGAAVTHTNYSLTVPEFHFADETFVQFRVMLEKGDLPMIFTLSDGTNSPLMRTFFDVTLDASEFEEGKWYTIGLHVKDGKSLKSKGTLYVYDEPKGEIKSSVIDSSSKYADDKGYFVKYRVEAPANNTHTTWFVDDIEFYDAKVFYENGMYFDQDFEDETNIIPAYNNDYSYIVEENGGKAMRFTIPADYTGNGHLLGEANWAPEIPDYIHNANDTAMIFSFDVKKENDSYPLSAYVCNNSTDNRFGFMIPAQQLREDVWYTYALVIKGNTFYYYRKAEDAQNFEACSYLGRIDATEKGFEKVEGNTDVEKPVISSAYIPGTRVKCVGFSMHNGNGTTFDVFSDLEASIPAGSSYLIDNVKVAQLTDIRADIKVDEDGVVAKLDVNDNRIVKNATKVMLVYFDNANRMIDAAMADVENAKAEVSMSAADTEAMATANILVWDEENVPVMSVWDITGIINQI